MRFREFDDEQVEAEYIAREIQFMINKKDVPPQDICILFRTNEQPRVFESELRRHEIRYVMMGSQSFFDKREIRDILAYLKVLENPRDENSLLRIINVPSRGIGDATIEKVLKRAVREGIPIWDAAPGAHADGEITDKAVKAMNRFSMLLDTYRKKLKTSPKDLPTILENLLHEIDYDSEIRKQYKNEDMQVAKTEIVDQMIDSLREYVARSDKPSLQGYLEETLLNGPDMGDDKEKLMNEQAVKLMTLHSAKGLEFPRVYMVGMEEGLLPHKRAVEEEGSAIDEERRLCYVGITRAQDHLTLTRAAARKKWGKKRLSIPSRFIREMRGKDE